MSTSAPCRPTHSSPPPAVPRSRSACCTASARRPATQVLVFVAAVEAGGTVAGEFVLLAFVLGVLASNTAVAALSTFGFRKASAAAFPFYAALAVVTAVFSAVTGLRYLGLI